MPRSRFFSTGCIVSYAIIVLGYGLHIYDTFQKNWEGERYRTLPKVYASDRSWFFKRVPADFTDPQWNTWKSNFCILFYFFATFVVISNWVKWRFPNKEIHRRDDDLLSTAVTCIGVMHIVRIAFYLVVGFAFLVVLHGRTLLYLGSVLLLNFGLAKVLVKWPNLCHFTSFLYATICFLGVYKMNAFRAASAIPVEPIRVRAYPFLPPPSPPHSLPSLPFSHPHPLPPQPHPTTSLALFMPWVRICGRRAWAKGRCPSPRCAIKTGLLLAGATCISVVAVGGNVAGSIVGSTSFRVSRSLLLIRSGFLLPALTLFAVLLPGGKRVARCMTCPSQDVVLAMLKWVNANRGLLDWNGSFNVTALRMVAFAVDWAWAVRAAGQKSTRAGHAASSEGHHNSGKRDGTKLSMRQRYVACYEPSPLAVGCATWPPCSRSRTHAYSAAFKCVRARVCDPHRAGNRHHFPSPPII